MGFRENLQHLRETRAMTQSELAMLVGVSRQSVTKWEAEKSYPEMDKLVRLCELFDCTIDDLVRGDLTGRAPDPARSMPEDAPPVDACGYDEHMRRIARFAAAAATTPVFGFAVANIVTTTVWLPPSGSGTFVYFACLALGFALLVMAGVEHRAFRRSHPYIEDFYTEAEKAVARRRRSFGIVAGALLVFAAPVGFFAAEKLGTIPVGTSWLVLCLVACLAVASMGCALAVRSIVLARGTDVERYNRVSELKAANLAARAEALHAKLARFPQRTTECETSEGK